MRSALRGSELAAVAALVFMVAAGVFHLTQSRALEQTRQEVRQTRQELRETLALKSLWEARGIRDKLQELQKLLPEEKWESFRLKKRSLELSARRLSGRDLNRLMGKLGILPLQIRSLRITRENDDYRLECLCKW